jgi:hypothetical protein
MMSGLFGAPFHLLQSPNLPVRSSKDTKKKHAKVGTPSSSSAHRGMDTQCPSLQSSDHGRIPQPQIQDLDGTTLAPTGSTFEAFKDIEVETATALAAPLERSLPSIPVQPAIANVVETSPVLEEHRLVFGEDVGLHTQESSQLQTSCLVSPLHPSADDEDENRDYSPVMDQLDETMDLLKSMQVAARAANNTSPPAQTPQPLALASARDKVALSTPGISFSSHSAQKEAWLAGYSSGLAHAHSQALSHIEELGNVQTAVAAQKDAVEELRSKYENLASQLSFLQGTCTQAFTGIWNALSRNTNMIEERLQVEAALLSRVDSIDARLAVNIIEQQQQQAQVVALIQQMSQHTWWQNVRSRVPHMPPHVLLQVLLGSAVAEFILRLSPAVFGSQFRLGRKLMRKMNTLIALFSFLRLLLGASRVAFPVLNKIWLCLRTVSHPVAALYAAADRGEVLFALAFACLRSNCHLQFAM